MIIHQTHALLFSLLAMLSATAAAEPVDIGDRLELMVDMHVIDRLVGDARMMLHQPRDEGKVLDLDKPWEGPFSTYSTVIKDGDLYRLYYRGLPVAGADTSEAEVTAYAQSHDGVHWTKPDLHLFEVHGTLANNVVLAGQPPFSHNFTPFLDTNPNADPDARYKAVAGSHDSGLFVFASPDGIHWRKLHDKPVIQAEWEVSDPRGWLFDSQNTAFWSEAEQQYVMYYRIVIDRRHRTMYRTTSDDFIHWSEGKLVIYSDTQSTIPSHQIYTTQLHPYFRAPQIYIATSARFMPGRQALTEEEANAIGVNPRFFRDVSDAILMTSRPHQIRLDRTFMDAFIRPGIGPENWTSRTNYPALHVVQTGPTEMSIYVNQAYAQPSAHLRRYSLRLDGFASVHASYEGGEMITRPIIFQGDELHLNFATSAAGGIRVEIQDAQGQPIPGFTLDEAQEMIGNEIQRAVRWEHGTDVSSLAGRPVRLRFVMQDADLYAMQFRSKH